MTLPFHPLVNAWFTETYRKPTPVQEEAWPLIAEGKDILAIAPTGSGKTLTAFLYALSRFIDGSWNPGELCVVYVSPLKALNEDIRRNLIEPIEALKQRAEGLSREDNPVFRIRAETRSGDTPQTERRRFLITPPSILAVTPESLAILLLNPKGREILSSVKYLVIDEIHAVMRTKRGAFLSCQIDRLARIINKQSSGGVSGNSGDSEKPFQRVALSATINPPEIAAAFAAGLDSKGERIPLRIVAPRQEKKIILSVEFPPPPENPSIVIAGRYGPRYEVLVNHILYRVHCLREQNGARAKPLLVFTDSRRRAERITFLVNETAGTRLALCHHGSLSKETRREVEQSLARGTVFCVVATSSLELGLDIGDIEEVILAGTPSSCSRALQRVGRSGHGVGEESRGTLVPFHAMDLLMGAILAGAATEKKIEKTHPVKNPLDILAQTMLALCTEEAFTADELYSVVRKFNVFSGLARAHFNSVLSMLEGNYFPETKEIDKKYDDEYTAAANNPAKRLRELKPRLYRDTDGTLYPARGTLALLYSSGGVIPSRGLYSMRLPDGTKIGELDEEFVFERRTGDSFDFGARSWKVSEIGNEAIVVEPLVEAADFQPFWKADTVFRSPELCERTLAFFHMWNEHSSLPYKDTLTGCAAEALENFLQRQQEAQGGIPLPDQAIIPVEIIDDPALRPDAIQIVFHSFRGGAIHYPLSMALSALLEEKTGMRCEVIPDDNTVLIQLPRLAVKAYSERFDPAPLIKSCIASLGSAGEPYFKKRLEASGIFGAAFREASECSMILPRGIFGKRVPLWVIRQRAKRLFDRAAACADFPLITEAWRTCLLDRFDMKGFRGLLDNLVSGVTELRFFRNHAASPFARDLSWKETNSFMYEYDERNDILGIPAGSKRSNSARGSLADKAVSDALHDPSLRPLIPAHIHDAFTARERRELPGYAPEDTLSLSQWVKDRIAVPLNDEWKTLRLALSEELDRELENDPSLGGRIAVISFPGATTPAVVHSERAAVLETLSGADRLEYLAQWMSFEGLLTAGRVAEIFGCTGAEAEDALDALVETGDVVNNCALENSGTLLFCDSENYELLLRLTRKKARPVIKERPASLLVPFIARRQGLIQNDPPKGESSFEPGLRALSSFPAPVKLWETEIFPARGHKYKTEILDAYLEDGRFMWFGAGQERAAFSPPEEFELAASADPAWGTDVSEDKLASSIVKYCGSYHTFWELKDALEHQTNKSLSNSDITAALWKAVWRGTLSSDSWESVRRGIEQGFIPKKTESALMERNGFMNSKLPGIAPSFRPSGKTAGRRLPDALKHKWREGAPVSGRWYSLEMEYSPSYQDGYEAAPGTFSALEREELNIERVRILLRRWGILCRPLLETEALFSWAQLLPAMRRMELAGELVTGRFFEGIPSLQFAAPAIAEELEAAEDAENAVYWMNAVDPASPAGWNIEGLDPRLPARSSSSRLCFWGKTLCAVALKNGRELELFIEPNDPALRNVLPFLSVPRKRMCHPVKKIALETINGKPAAETPYAPLLSELGFIADRGKMLLW